MNLTEGARFRSVNVGTLLNIVLVFFSEYVPSNYYRADDRVVKISDIDERSDQFGKYFRAVVSGERAVKNRRNQYKKQPARQKWRSCDSTP